MLLKLRIFYLAIAVTVAASILSTSSVSAGTLNAKEVLETYANIALAKFQDSLSTAKALDSAIGNLIENPSEATLNAAKSAWIEARVPYQQTEVYRFGNAIVDDWEGRVNAWPLDEGLIDYVDSSYGSESDENSLYAVNVIANTSLTVNGKTVDASVITPTSFCSTGVLFTPVTVIVKLAVSVAVPSLIVYTKTSVTVSPASNASAPA